MILDNNEVIPQEDAERLKSLVDATRLDIQLKDVCQTLEAVQSSLNKFDGNNKWLLEVTDLLYSIARAYNLIRGINANYAMLCANNENQYGQNQK